MRCEPEHGALDHRDQRGRVAQRQPVGAVLAGKVEPELEPSIGVEPNASYWLRGGIAVVSEDGTPYEVRNRQTLCRCGNSGNKPFCDGRHKRTGFVDPAVPS